MELEEPLISSAEEKFCLFKLDLGGSFMTSLINTIFKADMVNRSKIAKGFPEIVDVVNRFNNENGYWQDLMERWNIKHPTHKL